MKKGFEGVVMSTSACVNNFITMDDGTRHVASQ
jgi:hypothetical protein